MRRSLITGSILSALLAATPCAAQTVTKTLFNSGAGITIAHEDGEPFSQQTYAELVAGGEPEEFVLAVDLGGTNYETMMRFDNLFGTEPGQIPAGAHIVSASLAVRTVGSGDGSSVHRMLLPFVPETDTWDNWGSGQSGRNGTPGVDVDGVEAVTQRDFLQGPTADGVTKMDVTASLKAWQSAGDAAAANAANQGWLLDAIDTGGWDFTGFDAAEPSERPRLQVTYTDVPPTTVSFQQNTAGYAGYSDTYLSESQPETTFGTSTDLIVGNVDESGKRTISLIEFEDIIGDGAGKLPSDAQLVRATLKLQLFQAGEGLELRRLGAEWSDETATWDNFAESGGVSLVRDASTVGLLSDQEGTFVEFDVTGGVQAWLNGADNFGWALTSLPSAAGQTLFTAADFGVDAPILELTYIPGEGTGVPEPSSVVLLLGAIGAIALRSARVRRAAWTAAVALTVGIATNANAQQLETATFNTGAATMYNEGLPDFTLAQLIEDGDPDPGDISIDMGPLREGFLRFDGPIFGAGAGLVPSDAFIIRANLTLETTSEGDGALMHRMLLPFDPATDTFNTWGSGLNGRNTTPGVQADDIEAVAEIDVDTGEQLEGFSQIDVTSSLLAWQAAGDAAAANAANLGWYMQAIDDAGWDFNVFDGDVPPQLTVQYSNIAPTVLTFQQGVNGYEGVTDTYIAESDPDASFGDSDDFSVSGLDDGEGERIGLIRFEDVIGEGEGQLPANATLVRAELKLNAVDGGDGLEIRQMLTEWTGDDSWTSLIDSAQMSLLTDDSIGEVDGEIILDVTRSVQAWMDGDENLGWAIAALLGSDGEVDFASSDLNDSVPGDTDGNGEVDLDDLNAVRNNFGSENPTGGDANGDGIVDLEDLNAVRNNFGATGGGPSGLRPLLEVTFLPGVGAAVPEPATWTLMGVGMLAVAIIRRQRRA
jgi:hypothetical protein